MHMTMQSRVDQLLQTRQIKERNACLTKEQRDHEQMIRREMDLLRREEKLENVQRIDRANQHKKTKIIGKMQEKNEKCEQILSEKNKMLNNRVRIRNEATKNKQQMLETVHKMRMTGNFDFTKLHKLGISTDEFELSDGGVQSTLSFVPPSSVPASGRYAKKSQMDHHTTMNDTRANFNLKSHRGEYVLSQQADASSLNQRVMSPDKNSDIEAVISVPQGNIVDLGIAQMRKKNLKSITKQ